MFRKLVNWSVHDTDIYVRYSIMLCIMLCIFTKLFWLNCFPPSAYRRGEEWEMRRHAKLFHYLKLHIIVVSFKIAISRNYSTAYSWLKLHMKFCNGTGCNSLKSHVRPVRGLTRMRVCIVSLRAKALGSYVCVCISSSYFAKLPTTSSAIRAYKRWREISLASSAYI